MTYMFKWLFVCVSIWITLCGSLEIIPEQAAFTYVNKKYLSSAMCNVRRYGRNSPYALNVDSTTLHTWANNVSIHVVLFEFLHNEYRRSFIEMKFKLCDLINHDAYMGFVMRSNGLVCPMPPARYNLGNLTMLIVPGMKEFPYKWPLEKAKVVLYTWADGKELISEAFCISTFKNNQQERKKPKKGS